MLSACPGLQGVELAAVVLTPAVCKALGAGIRCIAMTTTGVAGPIAPVFASLAAGGCGEGLEFLSLGGNTLSGPLVRCSSLPISQTVSPLIDFTLPAVGSVGAVLV
jgi:hypothetical protein